MKQTIRQISLFFVVAVVASVTLSLVACNEEDDIDIFVERTWKVSNFFGASDRPVLSEEQANEVAKEGTFYIKFESRETFSGRTKDKNFNGTWSVDLKERTISLRVKDTGGASDRLSNMLIQAIQKTTSYEGDYKYLKLKEIEEAYILFRPY